MRVRFTKAHGSKNDFLLTWAADAPQNALPEFARAICHRNTGVGADGWLIVTPGDAACAAAIQLLNSDGSASEMSGNGTRCAAAFLLENGFAGNEMIIQTGAGPKHLRVLGRSGPEWRFEMNMGRAYYTEENLRFSLQLKNGTAGVTILNVGNPQCAVFVEDFSLDWRAAGCEIEHHPMFPDRTNVSFVKTIDRHTIDVRFWERGAGETQSSGTGSTGAAFAAFLRGLVDSPVTVLTPAGPLHLRLEGDNMLLAGPAELVASGEFFWKD